MSNPPTKSDHFLKRGKQKLAALVNPRLRVPPNPNLFSPLITTTSGSQQPSAPLPDATIPAAPSMVLGPLPPILSAPAAGTAVLSPPTILVSNAAPTPTPSPTSTSRITDPNPALPSSLATNIVSSSSSTTGLSPAAATPFSQNPSASGSLTVDTSSAFVKSMSSSH